MMQDSIWAQSAVMALTCEGHDPNIALREITNYLAGHHYDLALITRALEIMGPPPDFYNAKVSYEKARQKYIETGDMIAYQEMIDQVTNA